MGIELAHIHAAHLYRASIRIPEPGDQAGGSGLAAARRPHQRHRLSGLGGEGDMGQGGGLRAVVGKTHIPENHPIVLGRLGMLRYRQCRRVHNRLDAAQSGVGQHHAGGRKHDFGQRGGNDSGEHGVKSKVRYKSRIITGSQRTGSQEQHHRHQKQKGALGEGQVDGLGHTAHIALIVLRLGAVVLDGLLKGLEGVDGLLKNFDYRDAAHILGAGFGHAVLSRLVLCHQCGILAAHHAAHGEYGNHRRQQAGRAHAPVKHEHQHQHGEKQCNRAYNVRQIVGQQRFRVGGRRIQLATDQTGGIGVKITQRCLHHMGHALLADVGCRAERSQVGTHQAKEVDEDTAYRKSEGDPTVVRHAPGLRPVRRHSDQISCRQPNAEVRDHAAHHGHRRQSQPQEGEPPVAARISQQNGQSVLLLLLHKYSSF